MVMPFVFPSLAGCGVTLVLATCLVSASSVTPTTALRTLKPILVLCAVLIVAQLLVGGDYTTSIFGDQVSKEPWVRAVLRIEQLLSVVMLGLWLTESSSPKEMAEAIRWWLSPLRVVRVRVDDLAMTMAIALATIPMMHDELENLQLAQDARGITVRSRSPIVAVRLRMATVVAMFVLSLRHAQQRAEAMYVRGYRSGVRHTSYRQKHVGLSDLCLVAATAAVIVFSGLA